jgi:non-ribosomal peptide synthetase component E (peptide arylation enzyme)
MLFREYWGRPQATADAFDDEGYFKTGDVVEVQGDPPYYRVRSCYEDCVVCTPSAEGEEIQCCCSLMHLFHLVVLMTS